jgi:hypothetical protein
MEEQEFGPVRNRDREQLREDYDKLMLKGENSQIKAMRLVDGTEFFILNSASNISIKDGKVRDAKKILKRVSYIYDEKLLELKVVGESIEEDIKELNSVIPDLEKYQMLSKLQELNDLIEILSTYPPKLEAFNEHVEKARAAAIENTKKKIIHLHKNEFIDKV